MRTRSHRSAAVVAVAGAAVAIAIAGCGATGTRLTAASVTPAGWRTLSLPSGGALPYPRGWRRISGDPGSRSAALFNRNGTIRAYLNATPATGDETLAGWTHFRLAHNAEDGDSDLRLLASQTDVPLDAGRASCVTDQYTTSRSTYRELACAVASAHTRDRTVLVAAAQPAVWTRERPALEFAIHHFAS